MKTNVYFHPITEKNRDDLPKIAFTVFKTVIGKEKIILKKELPIKIHVGEPGNISYVKPINYDLIINFLKEKGISPYFIETTTVTGQRNTAVGHEKVACQHGFNQIPFIIADGEKGEDEVMIKIKKTKHFKQAKIARQLADKNQVLVISHFKGHIDTGFGGAIKNLGIGFASRLGKIQQHSRFYTPSQKTINWADWQNQYHKIPFEERVAEYALAVAKGKNHLYINFVIDIVENCDCDGVAMKPIYPDIGVFASLDPVALDKACFDLLKRKIEKTPFFGEEIFYYGEKIGLGEVNYSLIEI